MMRQRKMNSEDEKKLKEVFDANGARETILVLAEILGEMCNAVDFHEASNWASAATRLETTADFFFPAISDK